MKKLSREPLLHFLLIGVALFLVYDWVADDERNDFASVETGQQIVVSAGRIEQLANVFAKTWQRPPNKDELQGLIDDFVLEEVYYRQAVAMGIDRDDTIIRRRLRQKMEFLTDDTAALIEPTEEELATYLAEHEDTFRESGTYTFQQVYFNPEKHGDDPEDYVAEQLTKLRSAEARTESRPVEFGDVSLLPTAFQEASRRAVDGTFGSGFSQELDKLEIGQWQGPVPSGLGFHLIRIDSVTKGRLPELSEIRPIVQREWSNERRLAVREETNKSLLQNYDVVIQWPEQTAKTPDEAPTE